MSKIEHPDRPLQNTLTAGRMFGELFAKAAKLPELPAVKPEWGTPEHHEYLQLLARRANLTVLHSIDGKGTGYGHDEQQERDDRAQDYAEGRFNP